MGSVVIDSHGSAWQRHPRGWSISGGDGSWSYSWTQLMNEFYGYKDTDFIPTPQWAPVLGDPRLCSIIYVPHEELITGEEDEQ